MGRINNYDKDHIVEAGDKVIGSNKNDGKTGNYDVEDIAKLAGNFTEFFPLNFKYADNTNTYTHETAGYFTANDNDFGLVTTLRFNKTSQLNEDVSDIFTAIKGDVDSGDKTVRIKVSATDVSLAYGTYTVNTVTEFSTYFQFSVSLYGTYYRGDLVNEKRYLTGSSSVDTSFGLDEVKDDATPELGGFLDENSFGVRSKVPVKSGFVAGQIVALNPSTGIFYGAGASSAGLYKGTLRLLLASGLGSATPVTTLIRGVYNTTGLTTGDKYYLAESGYGFTNDTSGFASTSVIRYIGFALSTTKLYFDPASSYITKDGFEVNDVEVRSVGSSISATSNYLFSTSTTPPPASKSIIFNSATPASVTSISVSTTTNNNNDASAYLSAITTDTLIYIQDQRDASKYILTKATGASVDNTTYFTIPVSIEDSGSLPANNAKISALISIGGGSVYDDSWIQPALDLKQDLFATTTSVAANYTTANKNAFASHNVIMTAGDTLQLDDTGNTIGFSQRFINNTGGEVTVASSETVHGNLGILADGDWCFYALIATNEWVLYMSTGDITNIVWADLVALGTRKAGDRFNVVDANPADGITYGYITLISPNTFFWEDGDGFIQTITII